VATLRCSGRGPAVARGRAGALLLAVVTALGCVSPAPSAAPGSDASPTVELHFFDVGQGDAVLIRAPDGRAVLYDGGQDGERLLGHLARAGVTTLELVIASHNHADHIGGLVEVVERYQPRFLLENGVPHTTRTYERFLRAAAAAGTQRLEATRRVITLDAVRLVVIPPPGDPALGQNDNSVGLRIEYGEFAATLLGDSEPAQQRWWLERHADVLGPVRVHKSSHHGSRHGDTGELVARLRPDVVVISTGGDNHYGHPHASALELYRGVEAEVYRTDLHGTVTVVAGRDGTVRVNAERPRNQRPRGPAPARPAWSEVVYSGWVHAHIGVRRRPRRDRLGTRTNGSRRSSCRNSSPS
jgi:competence protein ComEC